MRIPYADIPDGESLIGGGFVYELGRKPLSAGYAKTGDYVGENRKSARDSAWAVFRHLRKRMRRRKLYNYR